LRREKKHFRFHVPHFSRKAKSNHEEHVNAYSEDEFEFEDSDEEGPVSDTDVFEDALDVSD
jgi:hypothetical protein